MYNFLRKISGLILIISLVMACSGRKGDYLEHTSGLKYKFIEMKPKGQMPEGGDILLLSIKFLTEGGLVVDENSSYRVQLKKPSYEGDIFTGLAIMQVGDSAHFMLDADEYYHTTRKRDLPEEFVKGDMLILHVKLKNIISVESLETERRGIYHTDEEQEINLLRDYIERTNVKESPTESGMYVIILEEGTGPLVLPGQTVSAHYTGKSIDGRIFDSSLTRGAPITFRLGRGDVIKGWDEGFTKLRKGSKARFIIPSKLAYGKDGYGKEILPYSTLIFDVELLDFK